MRPGQRETPSDPGAEPSVPPEVEEMLAAMYRPTSAEELFSAAGPSPERMAEIHRKIREAIERHQREAGDGAAAPPRSA